MPLKKLAKERRILITDSLANLLDGAMVAFQQALGGGNAQFLQVHQWAVSRRLLESADKIPQAHSYMTRRSIKRKRPVKVFVQPILRF